MSQPLWEPSHAGDCLREWLGFDDPLRLPPQGPLPCTPHVCPKCGHEWDTLGLHAAMCPQCGMPGKKEMRHERLGTIS